MGTFVGRCSFLIEFQNVTFTYQSTDRESGVYNLNLTIPDGQVVLLCGVTPGSYRKLMQDAKKK